MGGKLNPEIWSGRKNALIQDENTHPDDTDAIRLLRLKSEFPDLFKSLMSLASVRQQDVNIRDLRLRRYGPHRRPSEKVERIHEDRRSGRRGPQTGPQRPPRQSKP